MLLLLLVHQHRRGVGSEARAAVACRWLRDRLQGKAYSSLLTTHGRGLAI